MSLPVSDDRLDRVLAQLARSSGEEIAAAALPAEVVAERLAERGARPLIVRPSLRPAWLVALLLLAGLLLAVAIAGSRPTPQLRRDVIVYSVIGQHGGDLFVADTDGSERPLRDTFSGWDSVVDISPDGTQVAVRHYPGADPHGPEPWELLIVDIATGDEWTARDDYWCGVEAAWSTTGDRLAYTVGLCESVPVPSGASVDSGVFIVDVARRQTSRITSSEDLLLARGDDLWLLGWSPDGDWLLVLAGRESYRLLRVAASGGKGHAIDTAEEHTLVEAGWSPDGTQLVLSGWDTDDRPRVEVAAADGSARRVIADDAHSPVWSPDGDRILFARDISRSYGVPEGERFEFWVMTPDGRDQQKIATGRYAKGWELTRPGWTPDGTRIYWSDSDGTFTVRPDGTEPTKLDLPAGIHMDWWSGVP